MKTYGKKTGDFLLAQTPGTDACLSPTYYDAESVFYQIGIKYPTEATWAQYVAKAEACYRDGYLLPNGGALPGYWVFPEGARYDFDRTNDQKSREAIHGLATMAMYCQDWVDPNNLTNAAMSREVAYCLMSRIHDEQLGTPHSSRTDLVLDKAIGHARLWLDYQAIAPAGMDGAPECIGKNYVQPFMLGLTMRALIQYQAWKPDARIPPIIKEMVDYLQAQHYDSAKRAFTYENCTEPGAIGGPWIRPKSGAPDLNMLIVPAYAWVYLRTGDASYITKGDQVWSGGVNGAFLDAGKQFNQNHTWSFRYPEWRAQTPAPIPFARVRESAAARVKPAPFPKNIPKAMMPTTKVNPEVKR